MLPGGGHGGHNGHYGHDGHGGDSGSYIFYLRCAVHYYMRADMLKLNIRIDRQCADCGT